MIGTCCCTIFRDGQNDCNLLCLTTKHVFKNFGGEFAQLPWLRPVHDDAVASMLTSNICLVAKESNWLFAKICKGGHSKFLLSAVAVMFCYILVYISIYFSYPARMHVAVMTLATCVQPCWSLEQVFQNRKSLIRCMHVLAASLRMIYTGYMCILVVFVFWSL